MKQILLCAAIALTAALLSGGAASAASPAPRQDCPYGYSQSAPVHHNEGGHHYDRHHDGWCR